MPELHSLLQPSWQAEQLLQPIWDVLTEEEKATVQQRVARVFEQDIPFNLDYEKTIYIHLFSLLSYLELSGLTGLVRCLPAFEGHYLYNQLRQQFIDEVVHAVLFMRLTYSLCLPHARPVNNEAAKTIIAHFTQEEDISVILMLIYVVGETLVEALCYAMKSKQIAEKVFDVVLADENRHLDEIKLYKALGPLNKAYLKNKLAAFEKDMIEGLFFQSQHLHSFLALLGADTALHFVNNFLKRYRRLLQEEGLDTSEYWNHFIDKIPALTQGLYHNQQKDECIEELTSMRQLFFSCWRDPEHPTQIAQFSIDITPINFFEKKHGSETLTCIMLQSLSKVFYDNANLRKYYSYRKLYQANDAFIALVVKLPGCSDKIGVIEFKNCHEFSVMELHNSIRNDLNIMVYAHNKAEELKKKYPQLKEIERQLLLPAHQQTYSKLFITTPAVALSNVGHWGYEQGASPLYPNEIIKSILFKVEKRQIWNQLTQCFEVQDRLPISLSVDHRIFDANIPFPKYIQEAFNAQWQQMQNKSSSRKLKKPDEKLNEFIYFSNHLIKDHVETAFVFLLASSFLWKNHMPSYQDWLKQNQDVMELISNQV